MSGGSLGPYLMPHCQNASLMLRYLYNFKMPSGPLQYPLDMTMPSWTLLHYSGLPSCPLDITKAPGFMLSPCYPTLYRPELIVFL